MTVLIILIPASLALASLFLAGFIWAVKSGQYEDTYTPSVRVLSDEIALGNRSSLPIKKSNAKPK